jgi:hypothetical protein
MNTILFIEVSPRGKESASRAVADALAARLSALYPSAKLVRRDLAADHPPHLDDITLRAISTKDADEAERLKEVARRSDQLTNELLEADLLVIATPMWNFGIPLYPQSVDRSGGSTRTNFSICRWRRRRFGQGQEGHSGAGFGGRLYGRTVVSVGFCRTLPASDPGFYRYR